MDDFQQLSQFIDAISRAEETNSRNEKIQILDEIKANKFLKQVCKFVFNNLITLGVTGDFLKLEDIEHSDVLFKNDLEVFTSFNFMIDELSSRRISGNAARKVVKDFIEALPDHSYQHWFLGFIDKKFVTGFSVGSIVKIYPGLKSLCEVQTAETWTPSMKIDFEKEDWISEYKIDGMRMTVLTNDAGVPIFLSRDSKPLPEENLKFLIPILEKALVNGYVLDGEIYASDWNTTVSISKSINPHPNADSLRYFIFDCIPKADFMRGQCSMSLKDRISKLNEFVDNNSRIVRIPQFKINSEDDLNNQLEDSIKAGYEGLIIKDRNSGYEGKRKLSWLKVKKFYTEDFRIVKTVPGTGKYSVKPTLEACKKAVIDLELQVTAEDIFSQVSSFLGAFVIQTGENKECNVGSGFSDSQRIYFSFLDQTEGLSGRLCEVTFQEKTKDFSLRFPTFHRLRIDRG